ncbi:MAG TPA: 6-bladed beta-propeller [Candidatus Sulfotelmatobacter sp.]|nr:6-bladed beta-propeller [Candidatus Sulfotelmatobacter sp.]
MFSHQVLTRLCLAVLVSGLVSLRIVPRLAPTWGAAFASPSQTAQKNIQQASASLTFVRVFSSADDVRPSHPILDRSLDIIAGPADPVTRLSALQSPSAVTTDSNHRVFVADPGAKTVHIFDFIHSKYGHVDGRGNLLQHPVSLAVDGQDNLYVGDQNNGNVLVYDSGGKFRRYFGKLRGGESYFGSPTGIAIDRATAHIYVCDRQRHMIIVMDERGRLIRKLGVRGGGDHPGEFRLPTQVVVSGSELFVLDVGNSRIQILDTGGHFLRAMNLAYADSRTGLAVDRQHNIYVSDPVLNKVQVFRNDGQTLYTFDTSTVKDGNISRPTSMWVDGDRSLYIVDSQSNRIGLFQINGQNTSK